jgi:hypothetical protein
VADSPPNIAACSSQCADVALKLRAAIDLAGRKALRSSLNSAWFCWLFALIFGVFGGLLIGTGGTIAGVPILILALGFALGGYWYYRTSTRDV